MRVIPARHHLATSSSIDYFGPRNVGPIYGLMLTAWSFASVFGPLYIARMRETTGNYAPALLVIAG
jgi:MFS transporter, OFA family, oxalate/formate antiporter